ncbi:SHOCT domain-containing protein [Gordonia sp. CPCC 206044]|uniref:SHOCT domain-containing protein n=1 Tax=Gordonia sp. CPCC 206044 TaxID=3140793 RepID=UPI003AF34CDA
MWDSFWDFIWYTLVIFCFLAYLMVLFWIITDLFRDRALSGWWKAVWVVFLIILPWLTSLVYLIARGRGMSERSAASHALAKQQTDEYIRSVSGKSSAEQIADAKALLDAGTITPQEFESLKAKALA